MNDSETSPRFGDWFYQVRELSPSDLIPYIPDSEIIAFNWNSAYHVLAHLVRYPEERIQLIEEARRRSPRTATSFYVDHPLLRRTLIVTSHETDETFVYKIRGLLWKIEFHDITKKIRSQYPQDSPHHPPLTNGPLINYLLEDPLDNEASHQQKEFPPKTDPPCIIH